MLPDSVTCLRFGYYFNQPFTNLRLPASLTNVDLIVGHFAQDAQRLDSVVSYNYVTRTQSYFFDYSQPDSE